MKAILIIDEMPECCLLCDFRRCTNLIVGYPNFCIAHDMDEINVDLDHERESWCPLHSLPERKDAGTVVYKLGEPITKELADKLIDFGFNECLVEITEEV